VFGRYDENTIENVFLDEVSPGSFVRRAHLHHRSSTGGESLDYTVVQTTELKRGRVVRQMNVLGDPEGQYGSPNGARSIVDPIMREPDRS